MGLRIKPFLAGVKRSDFSDFSKQQAQRQLRNSGIARARYLAEGARTERGIYARELRVVEQVEEENRRIVFLKSHTP
ncbi:MAG: hypothetical protein WD696_04905 [Bryobacteraceae bacterium]